MCTEMVIIRVLEFTIVSRAGTRGHFNIPRDFDEVGHDVHLH